MTRAWPVIGTGRTLRDEVCEAIRERLLAGEAEPGTFLRETELATAMGVSRTPVREALGRLASEGYLERIAHRGFRVPQRSLDDLFYLYPVLQALEVLAGELAFPQLTPADLERLEEINREFEEALASSQVEAAVGLNERFHEVLAERCGNPLLQELVTDLRGQVRRLELWDFTHVLEDMNPATATRWVRQHAAVIEAVRSGAFDDARALLHENRTIVYVRSCEQLERLRGAAAETAKLERGS